MGEDALRLTKRLADEEAERLAAERRKWADHLAHDLLTGATEIAEFLGTNEREVYHLAKTKRLPIGRLGRKLVASRRQLTRAAAKITAPTS